MTAGKGMTTIGAGTGRKVNGPAVSGALALVAVALLVRGALLGIPALCDNTESRYGVIGMEMARSGDWLTPRIWYNGVFQPFWGKPPMHFWGTAWSFRVFGQNEVASRLPGFFGGLVILASVFLFARKFWGRTAGIHAVAVLASTLLFLGLAGSCTTDITLAAFLAVSMAAFAFYSGGSPGWGRRLWGNLFFAALAGGVLSKGPVALVLVGLSLGAWAGLTGRWRDIRRLPWWSGIPLFLALAVPWFVLAEKATPGFLDYYFVSEHFLRYIRHDYGDLYGGGHARPWGTIWALMAVSFIPWVFHWFRPARDFIMRPSARNAVMRDPWLVYALAWGLAPAVFFTFARQVLPTYLAPGMAGLAAATAVGLARSGSARRLMGGWITLGLFAAALAAGGSIVSDRFSAKEIIRVASFDRELAGQAVAFPMGEPYSGDFYSWKYLGRGMVHDPAVPGEGRIRGAAEQGFGGILLIPRRKYVRLSRQAVSRLVEVAETPYWVACRLKGVK